MLGYSQNLGWLKFLGSHLGGREANFLPFERQIVLPHLERGGTWLPSGKKVFCHLACSARLTKNFFIMADGNIHED